MILATKDIAEALLLSNSVAVMQANPGRIEQVLKVPLSYLRKHQNTRLQQLKRNSKSIKFLNREGSTAATHRLWSVFW